MGLGKSGLDEGPTAVQRVLRIALGPAGPDLTPILEEELSEGPPAVLNGGQPALHDLALVWPPAGELDSSAQHRSVTGIGRIGDGVVVGAGVPASQHEWLREMEGPVQDHHGRRTVEPAVGLDLAYCVASPA